MYIVLATLGVTGLALSNGEMAWMVPSGALIMIAFFGGIIFKQKSEERNEK